MSTGSGQMFQVSMHAYNVTETYLIVNYGRRTKEVKVILRQGKLRECWKMKVSIPTCAHAILCAKISGTFIVLVDLCVVAS